MKVYKFYADWCQPCKMLSKILKDVDTNDHELIDVNIDEQEQMAIDFSVRGVPTMVMVDESGKEVKRLVGMESESKLNEWFA